VKKILIMGLPGSGKTTLAKAIRDSLHAVHFNADLIRQNVNKDLGFSSADRIEQATRMGFLCDTVVAAGHYVVADFVCPTETTRDAFGPAFVIWIDRIDRSSYEDTNKLFETPHRFDLRLKAGTVEEWVKIVLAELKARSMGQGSPGRSST
jgi:hypothetical protein